MSRNDNAAAIELKDLSPDDKTATELELPKIAPPEIAPPAVELNSKKEPTIVSPREVFNLLKSDDPTAIEQARATIKSNSNPNYYYHWLKIALQKNQAEITNLILEKLRGLESK